MNHIASVRASLAAALFLASSMGAATSPAVAQTATALAVQREAVASGPVRVFRSGARWTGIDALYVTDAAVATRGTCLTILESDGTPLGASLVRTFDGDRYALIIAKRPPPQALRDAAAAGPGGALLIGAAL